MTIDEVLKQSTTRPWRITDRVGDGGRTNNAAEISSKRGPYCIAQCQEINEGRVDANANADLIVLAVNAYERQRECLRELLQLLDESGYNTNPACGPMNPVIARAKEML